VQLPFQLVVKSVGVAVCALWLGACSNKVTSEGVQSGSKPPQINGEKVVGVIEQVNLDEGFVLISLYKSVSRSQPEVLYARGQDGSYTLVRLTGEQIGRHIAADCDKESVVVGNLVVRRMSKIYSED